MTDKTRAELRRGIEAVILVAEADHAAVSGMDPVPYRSGPMGQWFVEAGLNSVVVVDGEDYTQPPLTPAQQLALSVLLGEPDTVVASALADYLLDQGHEYATAVAERARSEERERCAARLRDEAALRASPMSWMRGEDEVLAEAAGLISSP